MTVLSIFTGKPVDPAPLAKVPARKQDQAKVAPRKRGGLQREIQKAMLAKVHIAKQRLGLDDEAYRGILSERVGVDSSKNWTWLAELSLLHFSAWDFQPTRSGKSEDPYDMMRRSARSRRCWPEKGRVEGRTLPWGVCHGHLETQTGGR
jgi:hypothetical protein